MAAWERAKGNVKQSEIEWGSVTLSMAMLAMFRLCLHFKSEINSYYKGLNREGWLDLLILKRYIDSSNVSWGTEKRPSKRLVE